MVIPDGDEGGAGVNSLQVQVRPVLGEPAAVVVQGDDLMGGIVLAAQSAAFRAAIIIDAVFVDVVPQMDHGVHGLRQFRDRAIGVEIAEAVVRARHHRQTQLFDAALWQGAPLPDWRYGVRAAEAIETGLTRTQPLNIDLDRMIAGGAGARHTRLDDAGEILVVSNLPGHARDRPIADSTRPDHQPLARGIATCNAVGKGCGINSGG